MSGSPASDDKLADTIFADIEQAFGRAGFPSKVVRPPEAEFTGIVGTIDLGTGSQCLVIVAFDERKNCPVYLSTPTVEPVVAREIDLADAQQITYLNGHVGIGEDIVQRIHSAIMLGKPDDARATLADLRETLSYIGDPKRNSSTLGNQRGSDLASLAKVVARLVDRIEKLEQRHPS